MEPPSSSSSSNLRVRKGAWTGEEDILLKKCIENFGEGKWHQVPSRAGLNRCRKSCRLRWMNYLKPDIKRGDFDTDEIDLIIRLHKLLGNKWSLIAGRLPGRTANDVKNYWNTHLLKKNPISSINAHYLNPKFSDQSPSKPNPKLVKPRAQILPKSANLLVSSDVINNTAAIPLSNNSTVSVNPSINNNASYCVADEADAIMWWENLLMNDDEQQDNPKNYEANLSVYDELVVNEEFGDIRTKVVEKGSNYGCLDELFLDVEVWNEFDP